LTINGTARQLPWTFGQVFRKGDIPQGHHVTSDAAVFQADVRNRWSDGSVKFAVLSGIADGGATLQLKKATTIPSGTDVVEPRTMDVAVQFTGAVTGTYRLQDCLGVERSTWSRNSAGRVRQLSAGPVMSEFHYYMPTSNAQVTLWFYLRCYRDGRYEVEVSAENGWAEIAAEGDKAYTVAVLINGSERWRKAITHYPRARWVMQFWSDPSITAVTGITPVHDIEYLKSTRLIPNFMRYRPSEAKLDELHRTWEPWQYNPENQRIGGVQAHQGGTGWSGSLGVFSNWGSLYCTTGDKRAFLSTVANHYCRGHWAVHGRDSVTGLPLQFERHKDFGGMAPGGATTNPSSPDTAHVPDSGILSYWLTGRYWFIEEMQFWVTFQWWTVNSNIWWVSTYDGTYRWNCGDGQPRSVAWLQRQLAGLCAILPDLDTTGLRRQYIDWLAWSNERYANVFARGTEQLPNNQGHYNNALGIITWGEGPVDSRPWMQDFVASMYSWSCDIEVPELTEAQRANMRAMRDFMFKGPVGRLGGAGADQYNYTKGARYGAGSEPCTYTRPGAPDIRLENLNRNYGEVYTVSGYGPNTNGAEGQALQGAYIDTPIVAGSYWAYLFEAVTLAVDSGFPGAVEARRRLTRASNWPSNEPKFGDNPEHGRLPR